MAPLIAILPAGGRGTRMSSITSGGSKEALPLGGRTVLDHVLDEAFAAGADRAIVVSSREKGDIEPIVAGRREHVDLRYQDEPRGLADAIVAAGEFEHDALILLSDTVFAPANASNGLTCLVPSPDGCILAQHVSVADLQHYGVLECENHRIKKILEKPDPAVTSSRLAVAARFHLSDRVLRLLREFVQTPLVDGEYDLTAGLNRALLHTMQLVAVVTEARRFDCGSPEGYRQALAHFGQ
ncbi:MAG: sugar phosphate nucleotidyltransferase [Fimbriimonadaceae bacterium]